MIQRRTLTLAVAVFTTFSAAWAQGRHEYVQSSSQTVPAEELSKIIATTPDGEIDVQPTDTGAATLDITKRVRTRLGERKAESYFDRMTVDISTAGATLSIIGDVPDYTLGVGFSIDYALRVPKGMALELRTSDGNIDVDEIAGELQARTSDGDITVVNTAGAELRTSDGDIRVESVEGDISAVTSDGDITIASVTGELSARSSDGDISCSDISNAIELQLSDGDATIRNARGGITARTSDGELDIENVEGPVELKTSDGDILLSLADSSEAESITCTSSDGNIRVEVTPSAAYSLEARTSSGRVNVEMPGKFSFDEKHKRVEGTINGGGPTISLRASDGSITIASSDG
jgi:DUF4097 and DUF4098 domain-containing protein YvlB